MWKYFLKVEFTDAIKESSTTDTLYSGECLNDNSGVFLNAVFSEWNFDV